MARTTAIELPEDFLNAIHSKSRSVGFTHTFYKYPARFSPEFARAAISAFSKPGDVVLDPFMGGGTTLVEALISRRHAIGSDISPLAHLVADAKTTLLSKHSTNTILEWLEKILPRLNLRLPAALAREPFDPDYSRGLPWTIQKTIQLILQELDSLPRQEQRKLARCALLRASQWAIDCRDEFPSANKFRAKFAKTLSHFISGLEEMSDALKGSSSDEKPQVVTFNLPAVDLNFDLWRDKINKKPKLVVTSPPYPSVNVIYHRWQIQGRRRTAAPFWILGTPDGNGDSYYKMGSPSPTGLDNYFESLEGSYTQIHSLLAKGALVIQLVAFSDIRGQYPRYLNAMETAGFQEVKLRIGGRASTAGIWRQVPHRRWYASLKGALSSAREVLLIHKRTD
jgi:hypothetical protein